MSSGLVLIDKPSGWTSHDVVARLRKLAGTRRVGHAGTLDPMATGLLLIGVNSATKLLTFLVGENKTYEATIRLGAATITDDKESEFTSIANQDDVKSLDVARLESALNKLRGPIEQVPVRSAQSRSMVSERMRKYARVTKSSSRLAQLPFTVLKSLANLDWLPTRVTCFSTSMPSSIVPREPTYVLSRATSGRPLVLAGT